MNLTLLRYDTIDSTNSEAARQARFGAEEGLCVIATEQTAGRGRQGRVWSSAKDSGLYFSIVLRPRLDAKYLSLITLMSGVAVHETLREFGLKPDIKWVNDVLIDDKKISGVLAETADTPTGLAVIVGIGINLASRRFTGELAGIATSIEDQTGTRVTIDEISETLTLYLAYFYEILSAPGGSKEIIDAWCRRSTFSIGKEVRVTLGDGSFDGVTDGLEENGALRVKTRDGSVKIVQAGDVERLRQVR